MRGRKPKRSALRILEGTDKRADRPIDRREPQPKTPAKLTPPRHLSKEAKKAWRKLAAPLAACGVLTEMDTVALEQMANLYARYLVAVEKLAEHGPIMMYTPDDSPVPAVWYNPWRAEMDKVQKAIQSLLAEFGMTPSSRTRVAVEKPKDKDSLSEFSKAKRV